ncbi:MAG TPA: isocitrate lyase [Gemmatimonadales bacterium]|jgi:isocitrate lyase|nr:isocitrate lyase [Gemmatimonadales bacterium]
MPKQQFIADLERRWASSPRWAGITRPYGAEDVWRLKGSLDISYTLAEVGANKLWRLLHDEQYVAALSAVSGGQAVQEVKAGLKAIYISGWQVAGDMNTSLETYPDQSLYPADSVPRLVERINNALQRADEIDHLNGRTEIDWYAPLVADAEAGFGGLLNAYELMKHMIQKGAAGVHFEDQLASLKKCGHLGGKVLVPTSEFITKLVAARLAADVLDVPTVLIARTDALSATILANDIDPYDREFVIGDRTPEGFVAVQPGIQAAIARGLAYAPYADLLWFETSKPDMEQAQAFAEALHAKFPGKMMAYNCSPSFNWKRHLSDRQIADFQSELGAMGYKFQFVTLSAFHAMNYAMFELAKGYRERGMAAYSELQQREFAAEKDGYEAVRHQEFVGVPYFDQVTDIVTGGRSSSIAMKGSTEEEQFHEPVRVVS